VHGAARLRGLYFVGADAAFKTTRADVTAFDFKVAERTEKAAAIFAHLRGAALRVIEAARFGFSAKGFGSGAGDLKIDSRENRDANGAAASAAADAFLAIPEFSRNRPGADRAGDRIRRHYLA
jgi:hypothetical protein